jgi:pimeloyl-ACP methyl ester carboxylesterase
MTDLDMWSPTDPGPPSGHAASADGTAIAWFRTGPADGPPILLIHGAASDHTTFRVVGPRFAERRAVHAMDRRGRGASDDSEPYAIDREAEDVAAVVDAIAADAGVPVDVVGHSYGGRVALGAAPLTGSLRRLVVYESAPAPPGMTFEAPDLVAALTAALALDDGPAMLRLFMRRVAGMSDADLAAFEASPLWPVRVAIAHTVLRELTADRADGDADAIGRLGAAVRRPVLQLLGGASAPIFALGTAALDAALPDGRIAVLDGQRHAAHHSDPDRFVAVVERFLDAPDSGAQGSGTSER